MEFRGVVNGHDGCWWGSQEVHGIGDGACRYTKFGQVEQIGVQHQWHYYSSIFHANRLIERYIFSFTAIILTTQSCLENDRPAAIPTR